MKKLTNYKQKINNNYKLYILNKFQINVYQESNDKL